MDFEIRDNFYLDGKPFQIISGAIHYFRTVPEYWRDRLEKLVNMGCNTVETYIPWNFHEPNDGEFIWDGMRDIEKFISIAEELGLYIIIRPSPYICAEWEFGGLPAWLLKSRDMRLRCCYKPYLDAVKNYYNELIPKIVPHQIDKGGRIILVQIENEYGYYGNDTAYLDFLRNTMRELGITVPFVTSDGPWSEPVFRSGMAEGALPTGNFGSSAEWQFGQMKKIIGEDKPLMCMEFWNGWFDAWGEEHHTTSPEKAAAELEELLKRGSLNFYMFEGGTNFGFMNGKNNGVKYGDTTSYDYDAPLTMEEIGQNYGYILYRLPLDNGEIINDICLEGAADRAQCYCGEKLLFTAFDDIGKKFEFPEKNFYGQIDILVENIGRENFGTNLEHQRKGIADGIKINGRRCFGMNIYALPFDKEQIGRINFGSGYKENLPAFYKFILNADECGDTFIQLDGFGKGVVFVNGFNIGRFWEIGPQKRLYIPAPLLKTGENTIIVFETEGKSSDEISLL